VRARVWMIAVAVAATGCAQVAPLQRSQTLASARAQAIEPSFSQGVAGGSPPTATGAPQNAKTGQSNAPPVPPVPPEPLSPFDDSPVIFTIAGQHFTRGERVIVTVCLGPNRSIASADIFESSGDSKFDQLALMWARRIRLREAAQGEQIASCGAVRVEVRPAQEPKMFHAPGDSLS
jgi:hypothetical protein